MNFIGFDASRRNYCFKCADDSIRTGDVVLCRVNTEFALALGVVTGCNGDTSLATSWIVAKVKSIKKIDKEIEKMEKLNEINEKMMQRYAELTSTQLYEKLAETDDVMRGLLEEYRKYA